MRVYRVAIVTTVLAGLLVPGPRAAAQPLDETFAAFSKYTPGTSRKAVKAVERAAYEASGDPKARTAMAARLIAVLRDKSATAEAKCLACLYVPLVCDEAAVKAVAPLLKDPKTAGPARGALQRLACPAADAVLRDALKNAAGTARVGFINSLGARRDTRAGGSLQALLTDRDPAVAAAAAAALGSIGSTDAAAALADGNLKPTLALLDALLECATRRLDAGDAQSAASLYRQLTAKGRPERWRWAGLTGLARSSPDEALGPLLAVLDDKDGALAGPALSLIANMPGTKATTAMTARLDALNTAGRVLLLGALGRRDDRSAAPAVAKWLDSSDAQVQAAAIQAIGQLGDEQNMAALAKIAASGKDPARSAARDSLVRLGGKKTDAAFIAGLAKGPANVRVELIAAAIARRADGIVPALMTSAGDAEPTVRATAYGGLAKLAGPADFARLVQMLVAAKTPADRTGIEQALLSVARRAPDRAAAAKPALAGLKSATSETTVSLVRVLGTLGGAEALSAVVARLGTPEATVNEAALRALANWPDPAACGPLLKIVSDSASKRDRVLAMRGYLRLAPGSKDPAAAFGQIRRLVKTVESKRMMLSALADATASTVTLEMAVSMLDDPQVKEEAALAVVGLAQQIARLSPAAAAEAFDKVLAAKPGKDIIAKIAAVRRRGRRRPAGPARASYGKKEVEARKRQLASRGPKGCRMVLYLDCGPAAAAGTTSGPRIKLLNGASYVWAGSGTVPAGTIAFDSTAVGFDLSGLDAKKHYAVGFSWWDYDHNDRVQSVWASPAGRRETQLLKATKLPSFIAARKGAAEIILPVPQAISSKGRLRLTFRLESGTNVVVGEVWLFEADAGTQIKGTTVSTAAPAVARVAKRRRSRAKPAAKPQVKTNLPKIMPVPKDAAKTNVLIVTGVDYPGHKWQQTAPVLAGLLAKDKRFEVQVVADPHQLASPTLHKYDVVVFHFKDYEKPSAWTAEQPNFTKFVSAGGGVVMVHFACGAWQGWDGFVKIVGRVWNPKMRGHDPRGPFTVEIAKPDHPIVKGMKDFVTTDELYTCLDGKTPIETIAHARSKVDKKFYAMAFILQYGKGRIFHCPLGHDVKAFEAPAVGELFRRGTAWAANLPPVMPK